MQAKRSRDTLDELGELKSRSGRVVRPKIYSDGTVALADQDGGDELPAARAPAPYAPSDDEDDASLSDGSEGSYGSTRTRTGRSLSTRPARRAAVARAPRAPPAGPGAASGYGGGGVFKQAAVEVLRAERRFMSTGEIARLALRRGLVRCNGKTPEATMASALYTDIKRKEENSMFVRPREGLFGLREWVGEGGVVQAPSGGPPFALGAATAGPAAHHHAAAALPPLPVHPGRHVAAAAAGTADPSSPGASQASGDRLMELLCAAEEINRAASAAASEEAVEAPAPAAVKEEEADDAGTAEAAGNGLPEEEDDEEERFERHASTALASSLAGSAAAPAVRAAAAVAAAEAELKALEAVRGRDHPEVGRGYLALANLILAGTNSDGTVALLSSSSSLPPASLRAIQAALRRADEVLAASATASAVAGSSRAPGVAPPKPPRTISVRAQQGAPTPPELAHAPTPPALEGGRLPSAAAPFWGAPAPAAVAAPSAPREDAEDVEICLPAPRPAHPASQPQQKLPLPLAPPVAAV